MDRLGAIALGLYRQKPGHLLLPVVLQKLYARNVRHDDGSHHDSDDYLKMSRMARCMQWC
jgi:hypothetical protein